MSGPRPVRANPLIIEVEPKENTYGASRASAQAAAELLGLA